MIMPKQSKAGGNRMGNNPKAEAGRGKTPLHLISDLPLEPIAWVMKHGADKYNPYDWRRSGITALDYIRPLKQHIASWTEGEDFDPESGEHHLAHAGANILILLDAIMLGKIEDNRPCTFNPDYKVGEITKKYLESTADNQFTNLKNTVVRMK